MKFGDKLIELRKKNGYSQEELAEKLGVSRQSVSKWESNNTYPETDKIIQIANLFDCSMDDLINDKVTDIESSLRKNKNIYNIWDSLLEFITKTINMFSKMSFSEGFKCVIEFVILGFILSILGHIVCSMASEIISNIFSFLSREHVFLLREVIQSIFHLIWFILAIIIMIYTFKIKYLNDYEMETIQINQNKNKDNSDSIQGENAIIRNENEKPFAFLGVLSKIVIYFIKFFIFCILIGTVCSTVGLVVAGIFTASFVPTHVMFIWILLSIVASIVISIQFTILFISFLFDKKFNFKLHLIIFIICIVLFGSGVGMSALSIKNIDFINDNSVFNLKVKELSVEYIDDLVIESNGVGVDNKYKYVIDNNMSDNMISVSREIDSKYFKLETISTSMDSLPVIKVQEDFYHDFGLYYKFFINNLKKNKIYTLANYGNDPLVIKANETTINKLIDNLKKLYLIEENVGDGEIDITVVQDKVYFKNSLMGEYNAKDDSIHYDVDNYTCKREVEVTPNGERIIYTCNFIEEG